jgi:hypothetical protein
MPLIRVAPTHGLRPYSPDEVKGAQREGLIIWQRCIPDRACPDAERWTDAGAPLTSNVGAPTHTSNTER